MHRTRASFVLLVLARTGPLIMLALLLGGCPSTSTPAADPNATTDPNAADWLDGNWSALALSAGESTMGCLTIAAGRVTAWNHGCTGQNMRILNAPVATTTGDNAVVTVTVVPTEGGLMTVTMHLVRQTDVALAGSITTVSVGNQSFLGTVTLTRR